MINISPLPFIGQLLLILPLNQKTAWLAIFYMCIPTGYALGYVYGGLVSSMISFSLLGNYFSYFRYDKKKNHHMKQLSSDFVGWEPFQLAVCILWRGNSYATFCSHGVYHETFAIKRY